MKIAFFDSGIGGLSVLRQALIEMPKEDYIYYADTDNVPYGIKSKDEVKKYIFNSVEFLVQKDVKAIVIACNTATSVAIEDLRLAYKFPIIGMEPAVKPAIEKCLKANKKVLVFATSLTLQGDKFKNLVCSLNAEKRVDYLALSELVTFAEEFKFEQKDVVEYLEDKLSTYNLQEYGAVVLGCTHFPFFKNIFQKIIPSSIEIIDGNDGTVKNLKRKLELLGKLSEGKGRIEFFNSGRKVEDPKLLQKYYQIIRK